MKLLLTFLLLLVKSYLALGQILTISGKVVDSLNAQPLAYVNITVKHKSLGAVSNEVGEFVFNVPKSAEKDTLVFSFIGYTPKEVLLSNLAPTKLLAVALAPKAVFLQALTVTSKRLTAESVVKEALQKISSNYPHTPHVLRGFFRDWKTVDFQQGGSPDNGVLLEAAVNVVDAGYAKARRKNQEEIYLQEIRRSELLQAAPWNYYNSLRTLLGKNYVKYTRAQDFSDASPVLTFPNKFTYTFSEKSSDDQYFVIEAAAARSELKYTIYISTTEYAIVRIDLKNKTAFELGDWRITTIDNTQRFRKWNGKWYLAYIRRNWQLENRDPKSGQVSRQENYNMEFLVNDILPAGHYQTSDLGTRADPKKPLEFQVKNYNEAFWQRYNILKDNPLNPAIQKFLEQKKSLPEQYKAAGKTAFESPAERPLPEQWQPDSGWVFTRADTLQGSLNQFRRCYDVYFYDLRVTIEPSSKEIAGASTIHFVTTEPTDKIQIDLNPALAIQSITWGEQKVEFTREHNAVFIQLPQTLTVGSKHYLTVKYRGQPLAPDFRVPNYGAFAWVTDSQGKAWLQSICQGSGANGWWPNKDHLSDKPDSAFITVTIPADLVNVSNGQLIHQAETPNNTTTYRWKVSYPILNYNLAVNVGDYVHWQEAYAGTSTFTLHYYALKPNEKEAKAAFTMVPAMLNLYEKIFGPYPFPKDNFKLLQTPYPMEHQSCVSVGMDFKEELILHETAHEWWGNSVSCPDLADIWIHESFATYAVYLFLEANRSQEQAADYLAYLAKNIQNRFPVVGTYGVNHIHYNFTDAYSKGALLLHTLRNLINNDTVWFDLLRSLQQDFKYKSITTPDLIKYINQKVNKDFSYLFAQYLYSTEVPHLELRVREFKNKIKVEYRWQNSRPDFALPVPVTSAKNQFTLIYPTTTWQEVELNNLDFAAFQAESNKLFTVSKVRIK